MDVFKNMLGQIAMKIMPWIVLLGTVFSVAALAHSGATGIVKERMEMFKKAKITRRLSKPIFGLKIMG